MANKIDLIINGKDNASGVIGRVSGSVQKLSGHAARGAQQLTALTVAGAGIAAAGLGAFFKKSSDAGQELEKSLISLDVISNTFGVSQDKAKQAAKDLGQELRIGTAASAESLQKLLKSGLNIDQASELMRRFTNEALTGKAAGLSLSDAVQNLAGGYQMEMSALMDRSGISENISTLMQREADARGITLSQLDEAARAQLKYDAFIKLTNETLGSSEKFQGTYTDNLAIMDLKMQNMFQTVGEKLNPVLNELVKAFMKSGAISKFTDFMTGLVDKALALKEVLIDGNFSKAVADAFNVNEDSGFITFLFKVRDTVLKVIEFLKENRESVINFGKAFGIAAAAVVGITTAIAILTSPLTLIIGLISLVALGFTMFQKHKSKIIGFFMGVKDAIVEFLNQGGMITMLKDMFIDTLDKIKEAFNNLLPVLEPLWNSVKNLFTSLIPVFKVVGAIIGFVLFSVIHTTMQLVAGFLQILKPAIQVIIFVFNLLAGVINFVVGVVGFLVQAITGFAKGAGPAMEGFGVVVKNVFKAIGTFIGNVWNAIVASIQNAINFIVNIITLIITPYIQAFNFILNIIRSTINLVKFIIQNAFIAIGAFIRVKIEQIKTFFSPLIGFISSVFNKVRAVAMVVFEQVSAFIHSKIKQVQIIFSVLQGFAIAVFSTIRGFIVGQINNIKSSFSVMSSFIANIFDRVRSRASSVFQSIKDLVVGKIDAIKQAFGRIGDGVGNVFNNVKSLFTDGFNSLIGVINSGISKVNNLVNKANEAPGVNFPTLPTIPKFATGGEFMVGGRGGTDNNFVGFMASRGERVTVETRDQQRKSNMGSDGSTVNISNVFNGTGLTVESVSDRLAFQLSNLK